MYVDEKIVERFPIISKAFKNQPIRRLVSENDNKGNIVFNVSVSKNKITGGFYEKYCVDRMELKSINITDKSSENRNSIVH